MIFLCNIQIVSIRENLSTYDISEFDSKKVLSPGQFIIPGFIDGHTHAVQFPNLGLGYNMRLLEWLDTYTFPLERKYTDIRFAERVFEAVVVLKILSPRLMLL